MKSIIRRFWPALLLLAFCCVVPCSFAQVNVDVTSAGGFVRDGIYMSPYYATIDSEKNVTIICDDFADETYLNTSWKGTLTSFSNLASNLGSTVWGSWLGSPAGGSVSASTIYTLYQEAAWLTESLLSLVPPTGTANQANYSFAEWAVFDPNGVLNWLKAHNDTAACQAVFGNNCTSIVASAGSLLYASQQNYGSGNYSNLAILTPLVNGKVCTPAISGRGNCPAQEFFAVVTAAEGGAAALYLLLAAAVCFGAMYIRSSRPNTVNHTA
jgi:hypothetical protein